MTATELLDELHLRWEACPTFADDGGENLICAECGWLRDEHPGPTP
jgi:hypothetical protein